MVKTCSEAGWNVIAQLFLGDDLSLLSECMATFAPDTDIVIITGGLGGTTDDNIIQKLASIVERDIEKDDIAMSRLEERLFKRFSSADAAERLKIHPGFHTIIGSVRLPNKIGIASGQVLSVPKKIFYNKNSVEIKISNGEGNTVYLEHTSTGKKLSYTPGRDILFSLLPGVPDENRWLIENELLKFLKPLIRNEIAGQLQYQVWDVTETEFETKFFKNYYLPDNIRYGINFKLGRVKVFFTGNIDEDVRLEIESRLAKLFGTENICNDLLDELTSLLIEKNMTVSTAESCTAGLIASRLTDIPGSSAFYTGSFITYSNQLKENLLGIPSTILENHGAVSRETVIAMGEGALKKTGASICLSVSGIAGPDGGTPDKPVGTVWTNISLNENNNIIHEPFKIFFPSTRESIRNYTVAHLLNRLRKMLKNEK